MIMCEFDTAINLNGFRIIK